LDEYRHELQDVQELIQQVKNGKALMRAKVSEPLASLHKIEGKLSDWLKKVDPGNTKALRQFAEQLIHGQDDRQRLERIMQSLDRAKHKLQLAISMHQSTITQNISDKLSIKSKEADEMRQKAKKKSGAIIKQGLTVSRKANSDTQSSDSEEDDSSAEETPSEESESDESTLAISRGPKVRLVKRNKAKRGARMINGPLGKVDRYAHVQIIEIEDNECEEDAEMINYAMDEDGMALWQKMRAVRIAEQRDEILWKRQHGFGAYANGAVKSELSIQLKK